MTARIFSDGTISELIQLYQDGLTATELAHQYGCSAGAVGDTLRRAGISLRQGGRRTYVLDEQFFDVIDTEEKAYWLGFLAGDGCIHRASVLLVLQRRDRDHLLALAAAVQTDMPIRDQITHSNLGDYPSSRLALNSSHMVRSLTSHGVGPHKSLTLNPWDGPLHLVRHYWRGLVDADGHISFSQGGQKGLLSLVGTKEIVEAFRAWVLTIVPDTQSSVRQVAANSRTKNPLWEFRIAGRVNLRRVAMALYDNCTIALTRKLATTQEIMATPESSQLHSANANKKASETLRAKPRATYCRQGHLWSTENTFVASNGHRKCRKCILTWQRLYRWTNRLVLLETSELGTLHV